MNYNEYMANIKAYRNGTLMQAAPTDALSDWHEKYFDTAVSALSKKMIADHVEHSEDADKFGKDFVSLVAILEEDGVSKQDIGKELEAVSHAAQSKADAAIKKLDSVQHSTDTLEGYQAAIRAYKEAHLEHGEWKKHKYIRIENGRYIYPEDLKKTSNTSSRNNQVPLNKQISNKITSTLSNLTPKKTTTAPTSPASRDQVSGKQAVKNTINEALGAFKNIGSAVKEHRSEAEAKKAAADAMKAGRTATQQYKESGQYERDVADEKAKRETMARQDEAKKITSLTPDEARKRAAELTKQNTPEKKTEAPTKETPTKESVKKEMVEYFKANGGTFKEGDNALTFKDKLESVGFNQKDLSDMLSEAKQSTMQAPKQEESANPAGGNRDMSIDAQEKAKKAAEEKTQAKKNEYLELGKKNGLTDSDVEEFVKIAEYNYNWRKDTAMRHATSRAKEYGDDYTVKLEPHEHGSMEDIVIYRPDGSKLGKFVSIENLESDIQNQLGRGKESPYYKQKAKHSLDPRAAFYAAVDDYKSKKGLNQRVPF